MKTESTASPSRPPTAPTPRAAMWKGDSSRTRGFACGFSAKSCRYQDAIAKGLLKGEAAVLLRQLERKFPTLPETARQRIAEADAETLLLWAERVLGAQTLDEVRGL